MQLLPVKDNLGLHGFNILLLEGGVPLRGGVEVAGPLRGPRQQEARVVPLVHKATEVGLVAPEFRDVQALSKTLD